MRLLLVATDAPPWARAGGCPAGSPTGGCAYAPAGAYDGDWTRFVRALVARYRNALGLEVWNEPNARHFFAPAIDPGRYTQLLREAYGAAKAVAPRLPVISGGLSGIGGSDANGMADVAFLRGMYRAGARTVMDGIGYHLYPGNHPLLADLHAGLNRIRRTRNARHDRRETRVAHRVRHLDRGGQRSRAGQRGRAGDGAAGGLLRRQGHGRRARHAGVPRARYGWRRLAGRPRRPARRRMPQSRPRWRCATLWPIPSAPARAASVSWPAPPRRNAARRRGSSRGASEPSPIAGTSTGTACTSATRTGARRCRGRGAPPAGVRSTSRPTTTSRATGRASRSACTAGWRGVLAAADAARTALRSCDDGLARRWRSYVLLQRRPRRPHRPRPATPGNHRTIQLVPIWYQGEGLGPSRARVRPSRVGRADHIS